MRVDIEPYTDDENEKKDKFIKDGMIPARMNGDIVIPIEKMMKGMIHQFRKIMNPPGIYHLQNNCFITDKQFLTFHSKFKVATMSKNGKEKVTKYAPIYLADLKTPVYETVIDAINKKPYTVSVCIFPVPNKVNYLDIACHFHNRYKRILTPDGFYDLIRKQTYPMATFKKYYQHISYFCYENNKHKNFLNTYMEKQKLYREDELESYRTEKEIYDEFFNEQVPDNQGVKV
jgi:hypothetical protein